VKRILVTGSRGWTDWPTLCSALNNALGGVDVVTIVHGAAAGADAMAQEWADVAEMPFEAHRAEDFPSPLVRNRHMVNLGADVCLAFAQKWASGTGNCARLARRAGIPVIDYGVDTSMEARP